MNFFKHQDDARKKTALLVLLFGLALTSLVVITAVFVGSFVYFFESHASSIHAVDAYNTPLKTHIFRLLQSSHIGWIIGGVVAVVALGVVLKHSELRRGGAFVAESLGGRLLLDYESDDEQKLLNIVEEMAIASGTPVPRVYILEDQSINAFAAGHSSSNAVVGVTRGALEIFDREEMQGVIAHEFSHIQNGDMRLNMRLLAMLNGIMFIGLIGEVLARSSAHRRAYSGRRRDKNQLAIVGIGLIVIGACGTFFGNMIKSAVSRQREFLADASAVQYTRNPQGIAKALLKIKQHVYGSAISNQNAEQFSHFYFSSGVSHFFKNLFATHPDIDVRISRIHPRKFDLEYDKAGLDNATAQQSDIQNDMVSSLSGENNVSKNIGDPMVSSLLAAATIQQSVALREGIKNLHDASRDSYLARVIVFNLILDADADAAKVQIALLENEQHPVSFSEFIELKAEIDFLSTDQQFALLQSAVPALQILSEIQKLGFLKVCRLLIAADSRITLKEWAIYHFIKSALDDRPITEDLKVKDCIEALKVVIRFAAELTPESIRTKAYHAAIKSLLPPTHEGESTDETSFILPDRATLKELSTAVEQLKMLRPLAKPQVIKALQLCIQYDGKVLENEDLMLRSIAACLDCPISL